MKEVKAEAFSMEVAMSRFIEKMSIGYGNEEATRNLDKSSIGGVWEI